MWNFEKFIVGRDGSVVARFAPDVAPDDPMLIAAIEAELAKASYGIPRTTPPSTRNAAPVVADAAGEQT